MSHAPAEPAPLLTVRPVVDAITASAPEPKIQYVVPTRASLARYHKYDAIWRAQFDDPDPNRRFLSCKGLAKKLGYGRTTVKRDLKYLSAFHDLPIDYFPARGGWGYYKLPARLSGIYMEEGELLVLAASWGALEGRRGSDLSPKVRTVMEKLMNVLGHDLSFDFKTVSQRIAFRSSGYHSAIDVATFETVSSAVLTRHEIAFTYRKQTPAADGPSPSPGLASCSRAAWFAVDYAWYIFADDPAHPEAEPHTFALFRMSDVVDTGRKFEPLHEFDLKPPCATASALIAPARSKPSSSSSTPKSPGTCRNTSGMRPSSSALLMMGGFC
jgi:hypothetical protein